MGVEYDPSDAVEVAYQSLPAELQAVLNRDDVRTILYLEFRYYDSAAQRAETGAPAVSISREMELMVAFIGGEAAKQGRTYTTEQIAHVLKGEDVYMRQIGLIEP